jgi:hypothetical protein
VHTTGVPEQAPAWHVSASVQPLPSVQLAPFGFAGLEQTPVAGAHVPALWHWSLAVHTMELLPVQTPDWQASVKVQAFPSLHPVPFGAPPQIPGVTVDTVTEVGDPGRNRPSTTDDVPGAWSASNRKLYSVPHRSAFALTSTA